MQEIKIIKIGGSIISKSDDKLFDFEYYKKIKKAIIELTGEGYLFTINIGGGYITRKYQKMLKQYGEHDDIDLHRLGVATTNVNVQVFHGLFENNVYSKAFMGKEYDEFIDNYTEDFDWEGHSVLVVGSSHPGYTNDWNAMQVARRFGVETIYDLKDVDGVYTQDPKKNRKAKKFENLTWNEYFDVMGNPTDIEPGGNYPVDIRAAHDAKELGLSFVIMDGTDIPNFKKAIRGEKFIGTTIS